MKHDFNGDGKADILVTSPWGLGILTLAGDKIIPLTMSPNGTRLGGWMLNTKDNNTEVKADFDGDGRAEVLISSPWGIGLVKLVNGVLTSIAMAQNGTRLGGWIINTRDNQILHAADFDGNGKEEVLVSSPWGIGILKFENNALTSLMLSPNGTRFGGWLLNTDDNFFTLVGDFDGDRQVEILVTSPWGLGILKFNGSTLNSILMAPNGSRFGDWILNTATDRFEVVGDFNGDGKAEIFVSNTRKIGILKLEGDNLSSIAIAITGEQLGGWKIDCAKDKMSTVGDFDGDGKTEILVSSNWGIGVLKLNNGVLGSSLVAANGTRFGGWLLNTRDNRLNYAADFDGDGRTEIQITSPWGMGILKQNGSTFSPLMMSPNSTRFGGWLLNTSDNDFEAGLGQSYGLMIWHDHWTGAINSSISILKNRGYVVFSMKEADKSINLLKNLSLYLKAGDRLFVYIGLHGGSIRGWDDTTKEPSLNHIFEFNNGEQRHYNSFAPAFELLANRGIDLIVFDGSCDGGEAVICANGERYLAMSTATVNTPGLTGTPNPAEIMQMFGKPSRFGLWWSPTNAASLLTAKTPKRFHQKIYRNDNTEISYLSQFYKNPIDFSGALAGGWFLGTRRCYLYRYVYPDAYNSLSQADKDGFTGSLNDYLRDMRAEYMAKIPSVNRLKSILNDSSLRRKAADLYVRVFPKPWQSLFGDMNWNVTNEPTRLMPTGVKSAITPNIYAGRLGFQRLVNEVLNLITLLDMGYVRQENLLTQIDAEVQASRLHSGVFTVPHLLPKLITDYLKYNEMEEEKLKRYSKILERVNVDRTILNQIITKSPNTLNSQKKIEKLFDSNLKLFKQHSLNPLLNQNVISGLNADLQNLLVELSVHLDKLFYLLIVVEEAYSWAQSRGAETGDLVNY